MSVHEIDRFGPYWDSFDIFLEIGVFKNPI